MYDQFSGDYDRFVNWPARLTGEMPFLEAQIRSVQTSNHQELRVLDTACGTGMHAIALNHKGFRLAGADLSAKMIEKAHQNAKEDDTVVDFRVAGFGELASTFQASPLFPFHVLLCLGNSLPHALTQAQLLETLRDFKACLQPGGLLLIQNRNFDAILANQQRWMEPQYHREGNKEWIFIRFYDFSANGLIQFNLLTLYRSGNDDWQQTESSALINPLTKKELIEVLSDVGFGNIICYGDMDGNPFDASSSPNLVVCAYL